MGRKGRGLLIMNSRLLAMGIVSRGYWLVAMARKGRGLLIMDSRLLCMSRIEIKSFVKDRLGRGLLVKVRGSAVKGRGSLVKGKVGRGLMIMDRRSLVMTG